ncbi:MAG TPA: oxidoreductase [Paludibacteraceae bacterium]|nr:oxidoreductase [Paludibacteraceae bacterium]
MNNQQVVLITGASSGIGKEAAKLLAAKGYKVYGASRNLEKMEELNAYGVITLPLDITDQQSIDTCVDTILKAEGRMDILVNNAGYGSFGPVEAVPIEEGRRQFEVNLFGLAALIQKILPVMRKQNSGRIINVSSMAAYFSEPNGGWYHATKAAVERYSDALRMEVKRFNIKVVLIQPGMIHTEWQVIAGQNLLKYAENTVYEASAKHQAAMFDMGYKRASKPEVVARAIVRAGTSPRPCLRYKVGGMAKPILFFRKITPDRLFDALVAAVMIGRK